MSIEIMTQVWKHSQARGACLLLLLALADSANDEGLSWPGQKSLAHKTRMSDRNVRKLIERLLELKELKVIPRTGRSNYYQVLTPERQFLPTPERAFQGGRNASSYRTIIETKKETK